MSVENVHWKLEEIWYVYKNHRLFILTFCLFVCLFLLFFFEEQRQPFSSCMNVSFVASLKQTLLSTRRHYE